MKQSSWCSVLLLGLGVGGCGTPAPPSGGGPGGASSSTGGSAASTGGASSNTGGVNAAGGQGLVDSGTYLPLAVGATWTYDAVDNATGNRGTTTSSITAYEDVGGAKAGTQAYRVESSLLSGGGTVNWQQQLRASVVRLREQFLDIGGVLGADYVFNPYRVRLDESADHTVVGATWTETNTADINNVRTGATAQGSYTVVWTVEAVDEVVSVPAGTFNCLRIHRVQSGYSSSNETQWFARGVGKVKDTDTETKVLTAYSIP